MLLFLLLLKLSGMSLLETYDKGSYSFAGLLKKVDEI